MDARVERIFRQTLEDPHLEVTESLSPENTPAWDDFAQVNLLLALEREFHIEFTMDEAAQFATTGDIVRTLQNRGALAPTQS